MYSETSLMYTFFQNFSQEIQQLEELCYSPKPTSSLDSVLPTSTISDYDLGGEGDLFKAPEPIIENPISLLEVDPMTEAIAMISCGDDVMPPPPCLKDSDMESLQNEQLLSDVFNGWTKELLEKTSVVKAEVSGVLDLKLPLVMTNEFQVEESKLLPNLPFTKSDSSMSLNSIECLSGATIRPIFLDFPEQEGQMRRVFSEGDIKPPLVIGSCTSEDRLQKLSRYRNKKSRRNFGRKIKYACRKALADSQPRIRGRFAKTEDTDSCKKRCD